MFGSSASCCVTANSIFLSASISEASRGGLVAQEVTNATTAKNNEILFKVIISIPLVIASQKYDFLTLDNWTEFLLLGSKGLWGADLPNEKPDCWKTRVSGSDCREVDTESELIIASVRLDAGLSMAGSGRKLRRTLHFNIRRCPGGPLSAGP
ncbi:hypothetical protein SBBP2_1320001 [Burkholderiales bacterium]|nr:hypothetical protein SBBP2_1320001 [Burkholderiales bacterium]